MTDEPESFCERIAANSSIDVDDLRYDERARALVRIGRQAIAHEDPPALDAYFSADFQFHGPDGDLDFSGLRDFFGAGHGATRPGDDGVCR